VSYEEISNKAVKVRKAHACCWCGERIEVGQQAQARAYRFEGDFHSDWMHPECYLAMQDDPNKEEGWIFGGCERPAKEAAP